jgi:membrane protease YdiL (CAAX protease family)
MAEALRSKDYRLIVICLFVCAASLFIGIRYFYRAFPEASIDFRLNKESSKPLADQFLVSRGIKVDDYRHASAFRYNDHAKVYLERELGLERSNILMGGKIKLWRWGHRWFKPMQKEEVHIEITPQGDLASFSHALPEDAAGADLPVAAARAAAESFLSLEMRRPISSLEYLENQTQKRPHRTDHLFVWKVTELDLRGASYRISVTVQGDRVDGYNESLRIPEEWSRRYARLRSLNESTAQVDVLFFVLLGLAMLLTLGRNLRLRNLRWKTALLFGATSFALQFLASLNEFPLIQYDFDTTSSYGSFVSQFVFYGFLGALSFGGIIFLLTICSEPLYRQAFPSHISIPKIFSWQAVRSRSFFIASLVGVTLTFFFFAYEIGFYLLANKLGAWAPAEIPYTDLLNTRFPWIFVLLGGFFPAVSEEWVFRAFALPYLNRLFRYRWIAVVLASFVWGFGHANYPNQPFFIRGIEVGIVGLVLSWAMFRYGILAPLIAHYSIDAFYSAFLLLRSGNAYLVTSGAITAGINLVPLLVAAGAYLVTRKFRSELPSGNESEGAAPSPEPDSQRPEAYTPLEYQPLTTSRSYVALAILAIGTIMALWRLPRFGDSSQFRISAPQAERSARQFLINLGFDVQGYQPATQPRNRANHQASQYLYSRGGIPALNSIYGNQIKSLVWETRYFKPLQKEEFFVDVDPVQGRVVAYRHLLPEEDPGADLTEEEALPIAVSFLKGNGCDLAQYQLKETKSEKPKQRRDTEFTWEAQPGTAGSLGDAHTRIQAAVLGDRIGSWSQHVKTPESWIRDREEQNIYSILAQGMKIIFPIFVAALGALTLVGGIRKGLVQWRLAVKVGMVAMAAELLHMINSVPSLFFHYDTQLSTQTYLVTTAVGALVDLIGIGLTVCLAIALLSCFYPALPLLLRRHSRDPWGRDAVICAAAALGGYLSLQWISTWLHCHFSKAALAPVLPNPDNLSGYLPLISDIRGLLLTTLFLGTGIAYALYQWNQWKPHPWLRGLLLLALAGSLLAPEARRFSEVILDFTPSALLIGLASLLAACLLRNNYVAYILFILTISIVRRASSLLGSGNPGLEIQGWALWLLLLGAMIFLAARPRTADSISP